MISKLITHDRQLGGKDEYERRDEEAFALLIVDEQPSQSTLLFSPRKSTEL